MNWNVIEGNWTQYKDQFNGRWARLTDAHLDAIGGKRDLLAGHIRDSYGISKLEAYEQIRGFEYIFEMAVNNGRG
jgi:uncharacterized protein YjbJ (UPF0337 family)